MPRNEPVILSMTNTLFQLAQSITPQELKDGSNLTPFDATVGNVSLSHYLWMVVLGLMDLAIYAFMIAIVIGGAQYLFSPGGDEGLAKAKKTFINAIIGVFIVFFGRVILTELSDRIGIVADNFSVANAAGAVFEVVMWIAGAGFLIVLLFGGVRYLTAGGNDEAVTKARKQILSAVIGVALVAFAYALGNELLELLTIIPK